MNNLPDLKSFSFDGIHQQGTLVFVPFHYEVQRFALLTEEYSTNGAVSSLRNSSEGLNGSIGSGDGFNCESLDQSTSSYSYDPGTPLSPPGTDDFLPPPPPDMA